MRRTLIASALAIAGLIALALPALAQVPETMSFQGQFSTTSGITPNSTNSVTFDIYDAATGGTSIWSETQNVTVDANRRFSVILGSSTPISGSFDGARWIAMTVGGTELSPRIELTASPYSLQAREVDDDAITSGKIADGAVETDDIADDAITIDKIGTGGASAGLAIVSDGSGDPVWGTPIAQDFVLPFAKTQSSASTLWSLTNSGTGGAGEFAISNGASPATALRAATSGTGAALEVSGALRQNGGTIYASGTTGTTPTSGPGTRLMWIPSKAAFRAGTPGATTWDADSIGAYSAAFGVNTQASGGASFAAGNGSTASGVEATAMGPLAIASGGSSVAMGRAAVASGNYSTAIGVHVRASGNDAVAIGSANVASGFAAFASGGGDSATGMWSTAMGNFTKASGVRSTALGYLTNANGDMSTAIGSYASSNGRYGSFVYGDISTTTPVQNSAHNQFMVRAAGGTVFYADSGATAAKGMVIAPGGNVGIGTAAPTAKLAVTGSVLASGTTGGAPTSGMGTRLMWTPSRRAFRAGELTGQTPANEWDEANLGMWSSALGVNTLASGTASFAAGNFARATGEESVAMGGRSQASGHNAVALGFYATASGAKAVALGNGVVASGDGSAAIGTGASTNLKSGSFIFGDASGGSTSNSANNQFMVRAAGGSVFYTDAASTAGNGIYFASGGNVGIGTSAPAAKLSVAGAVTATGSISASGVSAGNQRVTAVAAPTTGTDATNRDYVTSTIASSAWTLGGNATAASGRVGSTTANDVELITNNVARISVAGSTGNVGIGTAGSSAKLAVGGSLLASGTTGGAPVSGAGTRLMWTPSKRAFRAGELTGQTPANEWDEANLGMWSAALGVNTLASGTASFAAGNYARATGEESVAMGGGSQASGHNAVALGFYATASGAKAVALGNGVVASGDGSAAIGTGASTNLKSGSFIFGDASGGSTSNSANNQFMVRAAGGSVFYTDAASTAGSGIYFASGGNVGIGTSAPAAKLSVEQGAVRLNAISGGKALEVARGRVVASLAAAAGGTSQATAVAIGTDVMMFDVETNGSVAQATASLPNGVENGTTITVTTSDPNGALIYYDGPGGATSYAFFTGTAVQFVRVGGVWHAIN